MLQRCITWKPSIRSKLRRIYTFYIWFKRKDLSFGMEESNFASSCQKNYSCKNQYNGCRLGCLQLYLTHPRSNGVITNLFIEAAMSDEYRLKVDIAIIKEVISRQELNGIKWMPAKLQLAGCLTKLGADPTKLTAVLEAGRCNYSVAM